MINRQMQATEVWKKEDGQDEWGAPITTEVLVATIQCAINHVSGTNIAKDINYSEITHLGLTTAKGLLRGQILKVNNKVYLVDKPPNEIARFIQLYLKEVV